MTATVGLTAQSTTMRAQNTSQSSIRPIGPQTSHGPFLITVTTSRIANK
ncbi:MAG: hypothetical protein II375_06795 [Bacteroidales bacterium]|nr:hypothetical protein [Bacteroidales bacterium]